ncbi:amidohydrolase family protein [soil metagenome]|nr:amidohydrolase family protein [Gemmatimonadales bacterium]
MKSGMTRKQFLKTALAGGASFALSAPRLLEVLQVSGPPLDVVIVNGRIVDGTGRPAFDAALGIRGGRIVDIGNVPASAAKQVIDARGQYVCPGLLDPHAHEEILMLADPVLEKFVRQGVTTLINGNCGHSVTPYHSKKVLEYWWREALISKRRSQMAIEWEGVDGYAKAVAGVGATVNSVVLLGYGGIRWGAMGGGVDRPPTEQEYKEIERLVETGLEQGAVGMSTGLAYRPNYYAQTDELIRVSKILGKHGKTYASHLRSGPNGALEAVEIGEKAGCRVQLSHFRGGSRAALDLVTAANKRGLDVAADVIPQSTSHRRASNRMLEALMVFYPGAFDYSEAQLRALVQDPKTRAEIVRTVSFFNNDKNDVVIVRALTRKNEGLVGRSIADIAKGAGKDPNDYYIDVILDEDNPVVFAFDGDRREPRPGGRGRGQADPADQLPPGYWTTHARFGPGADSIPVDMDEPYGWYEHQRRGAFAGYFRQAREHKVTLEQAVSRATRLPAEQFGVTDRGTLAAGKIADVMVFDPARFTFPTPMESDPNDPFPVASGVSDVVVNGVPVLLGAKLTGQKPGKVIL